MKPPVSHAWRALRHRNFQLYVIGQGISLTGTWMTRIAAGWLVYRLTNSALLLGLVSFTGNIISFLVGPFAGVWVERLRRRELLLWTQAILAVQALTMAALTLAGTVTLTQVTVLIAIQGLVNGFDMPARQAFLVQMVDERADLGNAIAINAALVNGARLVGPAIAGLIIAAYGEGWCFLIDGVSYFAVITSLMLMRIKAVAVRRHTMSMLAQIREGWHYVRGFRPIRDLLLLFTLVCLMGWPYTVLLPVFASDVLHGGAHTLGWLSAAAGVGALASGVSLALRHSEAGLIRSIRTATAVFGGGLMLFGLSHTLWLSLLLLALVGYGMMQCASAINMVIQDLVPEDKRARVLSYYTMAFFGAAPFGSLFAGMLAHRIGAPYAVIVTGACCIAGSVWFAFELPHITRRVGAAVHHPVPPPPPGTELSGAVQEVAN